MIEFVLKSILLVLDKGLNVFPFLGSPHETISMRLSFARYCKFVKPRYWWQEPLAQGIDWLFWNKLWKIEQNHIYNSYEAEEAKNKQLWRLYVVTDQEKYLKLLADVHKISLRGRKP